MSDNTCKWGVKRFVVVFYYPIKQFIEGQNYTLTAIQPCNGKQPSIYMLQDMFNTKANWLHWLYYNNLNA